MSSEVLTGLHQKMKTAYHKIFQVLGLWDKSRSPIYL